MYKSGRSLVGYCTSVVYRAVLKNTNEADDLHKMMFANAVVKE